MKKALFDTPHDLIAPSLFLRHWDKTPSTIAWDELHHRITSDPALAENTRKARALLAADDQAAYAQQKSACGGITPAAQCQGGHAHNNIISLTGASMVDLDHVPADQLARALELVRTDSHTLLCHITTSGQGLRIFYRYTANTPQIAYNDAWRLGNEYYHMITGLAPDPACKDATRLSWLTHDPHAYLNLQCQPLRLATIERQALRYAPDTHLDDAIQQAQDILDRKGIRYDDGRHHYMLRLASLLHRYGVSQADTAAHLRTISPRGDSEADRIAEWMYQPAHDADFGSWLSHRGRMASTLMRHAPQGTPLPEILDDGLPLKPTKAATASREEIRRYLTQTEQLRYNVVLGITEIYSRQQQAFAPINDRIANELLHQCDVALGKYVRQNDFMAEITSELVPEYHPFHDYFDHLPEWDRHDHILQLARTVRIADPQSQPTFERIFRHWIVGMVASWLRPAVMNEIILTFIGRQGIYKSTFFRNLLPPEWAQYFIVKGNMSNINKDDRLAVATTALIDLEEIDTMRPTDLNAIKALVTTQVINERSPYAHHRDTRYHIASFCATGNNKQFLTDLSGNRRWMPFEIQSILSPYDHPVPHAQLYAQALHLLNSGFRYWLTEEELLDLEQYKQQFAAPCVEAELILRYYRQPTENECGLFLTCSDILARLASDVRVTIKPQHIGHAMAKLGIPTRRSNGKRGFLLVPRDYNEIQHQQLVEATLTLEDQN